MSQVSKIKIGGQIHYIADEQSRTQLEDYNTRLTAIESQLQGLNEQLEEI